MAYESRISALLWVRGHDEAGRPLVDMLVAGTAGEELSFSPPQSLVSSGSRLPVLPDEIPSWVALRYAQPARTTDFADKLFSTSTGDLLAATHVRGYPEGIGTAVAVCDCWRVGHAHDLASACTMGLEALREHGSVLLSEPSFLDHDAAAERSHDEKDEALVASWFGEQGELRAVVCAHTGPYLFAMSPSQGCECRGLGMPEPSAPGLWVLRSGRTWGHQEEDYTSGMDGEYAAATMEDVSSFGLDLEGLVVRLHDADEDVAASVWDRLVGTIPAGQRHPAMAV